MAGSSEGGRWRPNSPEPSTLFVSLNPSSPETPTTPVEGSSATKAGGVVFRWLWRREKEGDAAAGVSKTKSPQPHIENQVRAAKGATDDDWCLTSAARLNQAQQQQQLRHEKWRSEQWHPDLNPKPLLEPNQPIKPILRVLLAWNRGVWSSIPNLLVISKLFKVGYMLDHMHVEFMTVVVYTVLTWIWIEIERPELSCYVEWFGYLRWSLGQCCEKGARSYGHTYVLWLSICSI